MTERKPLDAALRRFLDEQAAAAGQPGELTEEERLAMARARIMRALESRTSIPGLPNDVETRDVAITGALTGRLYTPHRAMGPLPVLAPLMYIIEIISHLARVLSLTVRLYANMFAGDLLTLVFFSLVPVGIPLIFLGLHLGVAVVQAYVFMLLAMVYLSLAVSHDH